MLILWISLGIIAYILSVIFSYKMISIDYYEQFGMTLTEGNEKYPLKDISILISLIPGLNIFVGIICIPTPDKTIEKISSSFLGKKFGKIINFLRKIFDKIEYKKKKN